MKKEKIAKLVAKKLYNSLDKEDDQAIQFLVEHLVLPKDCVRYTETELENYILNALKGIEKRSF